MEQCIISFLNAINLGIDYLVAILFVLFLAGAVIWYTIGRIRNYINKGEYLFFIALAFIDELNKGEVSEALRKQFEKHKRVLTSQPFVKVEKNESKWIIVDAKKQYLIRKENLTLNVSERKAGKGISKGLFLGVILLVVAAFWGYMIIQFPITMARTVYRQQLEAAASQESNRVVSPQTNEASANQDEPTLEEKITRLSWVFRWILIYLVLPPLFYLSTRKHSGRRGLYTTLVVLTIGLFGWQFEHWVGVVLVSLPIYGILLHLLYHLSQVILPSADPENKKEQHLKFRALLSYMLGMQFPVWITKESAGREFEICIKGNNFSGGVEPGIVWARSHQVAGISAGIEFNQVEGPGIIFTKTYARPVALVDLRTQIRIVEFDSITKDGIAFKAIMFAAFVIDFEDWPKKNWRQADLEQMANDIRQNPYLEKGIKIDRKIGSYHYSTARVKSVLSTAGINTNTKDGEAGPVVNWDDWTLKQVENAARQVLSQRTLNELWRPVDNKAGAGALDEIAVQIRKIVEPKLRRTGINLFGCRVVNFNLPEDSPIRKQQIDSWKTLWDQRITAARSEAAAIREEEIEKAHAYAKSEILDAIADSLEKARALDPDLPRHVIALYYIHAIENIVQRQPETDSEEKKARLDSIKSYLLYNQ